LPLFNSIAKKKLPWVQSTYIGGEFVSSSTPTGYAYDVILCT